MYLTDDLLEDLETDFLTISLLSIELSLLEVELLECDLELLTVVSGDSDL